MIRQNSDTLGVSHVNVSGSPYWTPCEPETPRRLTKAWRLGVSYSDTTCDVRWLCVTLHKNIDLYLFPVDFRSQYQYALVVTYKSDNNWLRRNTPRTDIIYFKHTKREQLPPGPVLGSLPTPFLYKGGDVSKPGSIFYPFRVYLLAFTERRVGPSHTTFSQSSFRVSVLRRRGETLSEELRRTWCLLFAAEGSLVFGRGVYLRRGGPFTQCLLGPTPTRRRGRGWKRKLKERGNVSGRVLPLLWGFYPSKTGLKQVQGLLLDLLVK